VTCATADGQYVPFFLFLSLFPLLASLLVLAALFVATVRSGALLFATVGVGCRDGPEGG